MKKLKNNYYDIGLYMYPSLTFALFFTHAAKFRFDLRLNREIKCSCESRLMKAFLSKLCVCLSCLTPKCENTISHIVAKENKRVSKGN